MDAMLTRLLLIIHVVTRLATLVASLQSAYHKASMKHKVVLIGCLVISLPALAIGQNPVSSSPSDTVIFGKSYSSAQIAQAIKNSGLTEDQIRARLLAAGFDPKLAEPYFQT